MLSRAAMLFTADLTPLNNAGVFAHFSLTPDGNLLTGHEHATGLEPNMPHPQHIHGLLGVHAPNTALATTNDDTDHGGYVELAEGQRSYGPILLDLSSPPGGALADFSTAPGGVMDLTQTYDLGDPQSFRPWITAADLFPLAEREIIGDAEAEASGEYSAPG